MQKCDWKTNSQALDVAPLKACLPTVQKPWAGFPCLIKLGVVVHIYDPRTQALEAVGTAVKGHPNLCTKFEARLGCKQLVLKKRTLQFSIYSCVAYT